MALKENIEFCDFNTEPSSEYPGSKGKHAHRIKEEPEEDLSSKIEVNTKVCHLQINSLVLIVFLLHNELINQFIRN